MFYATEGQAKEVTISDYFDLHNFMKQFKFEYMWQVFLYVRGV